MLGNLPPFAINFTQLLQVLEIEHSSVVSLIQDGGTTFNALNADPAALRNLITAGDTTFSTLAANQAALSATIHVFPTFLNEQKLTMADLKTFSLDADPVIRELIPVAQQLGPTLTAVRELSPYLRKLFVKLGPLVTASQTRPRTSSPPAARRCSPARRASAATAPATTCASSVPPARRRCRSRRPATRPTAATPTRRRCGCRRGTPRTSPTTTSPRGIARTPAGMDRCPRARAHRRTAPSPAGSSRCSPARRSSTRSRR